MAVQESFVSSPDYCHTAVVTAELMRHGGQYSAAACSLFLHCRLGRFLSVSVMFIIFYMLDACIRIQCRVIIAVLLCCFYIWKN